MAMSQPFSCNYRDKLPPGNNAAIYEIGGCKVTLADRSQPRWFCDESTFIR